MNGERDGRVGRKENQTGRAYSLRKEPIHQTKR